MECRAGSDKASASVGAVVCVGGRYLWRSLGAACHLPLAVTNHPPETPPSRLSAMGRGGSAPVTQLSPICRIPSA